MVKRRLFIHAPNIHQGGGSALLEILVFSGFSEVEAVLVADSRMAFSKEVPGNYFIKRVDPAVSERFKAELWLKREVQKEDVVLCLGNLPPLFHLSAYTTVFVQNRYLIGDGELKGFPRRIQLRLSAERQWLRWNSRYADAFVVQTPAMYRSMLAGGFAAEERITILPFVGEGSENKVLTGPEDKKKPTSSDADFLYVASGEPHKNHRRLIDAWGILADEGLFPSLSLTLDPHFNGELLQWMAKRVEPHLLKIRNLGVQQKDKLFELYKASTAMIYPSLLESFGLPLIEAKAMGLPVIASELDYVRDILDPEHTFDPNSSTSIARAVKRFMGYPEPPLKMFTGREFLAHIWREGTARCES
jgi:glycosyltransferase involved in cell wall biosynthesis